MGKFEKLKQKNKKIVTEIKEEASHLQEVSSEYDRVGTICTMPGIILKDIERDFEKATKLNSLDIKFLFFATALQCIRQYFLTPFKLEDERPKDKAAAGDKDPDKEYVERSKRWYNPTFEEIWNNPVPFDANLQTENTRGALKGGGKFGHRLTLGHDPILGWIFGTANIATSTLTKWDLTSYHIKTGEAIKKGGKISQEDFLTHRADIEKIFSHTRDKLLYQGMEGKKIIGLSLIWEWKHLKSDVNSKKSLPFPIVSTFSPEMANTLAEYGVDACNLLQVGKQATYASLINFIVALIHRMIYDQTSSLPLNMYEVKTRKILTYSNVIATVSNVIAVAITEYVAVQTGNADLAKKGIKYLDIGGLLVTLYRLITDYDFIKKVKIEFMDNHWHDLVVGEDYSFMKSNN